MTSTMRFDKWENSLGQPYGAVLQVVQAVKTDTFLTTSSTFLDITGFSASITPFSASSKILVFVNMASGVTINASLQYKLVRNSTDIFIGNAEGSRTRSTKSVFTNGNGETGEAWQFLDSPATTASVTYKVQIRSSASGQTVAVNRPVGDSDTAAITRSASSITLMEIAQ